MSFFSSTVTTTAEEVRQQSVTAIGMRSKSRQMEIGETKKRPEAVSHRLSIQLRVEGPLLWFVRVLKKLDVESAYVVAASLESCT
jgi:hypothetical protein